MFFLTSDDGQGTVYPVMQAAFVGSTVTVDCISFSEKDVSWYSPNKKEMEGSANILTITNIQIEDSGKYTCVGFLYPDDMRFVATAEILVGSKFQYF